MEEKPIQLLLNQLKAEDLKAFQGQSFTFICVGGRNQGKTTFINNLQLDNKKEHEKVTVWSQTRGSLTIKFIELPTGVTLPTIEGPKCILLLIQLLQEQTGEFHHEVTSAKKLADELHCQTLLIHTFCDQTGFPSSFSSSIKARYPNLHRNQMHATVFREWKSKRDKAVGVIYSKGIHSACTAFSEFRTINTTPDGTVMMDDLIDKLYGIMVQRDLPSNVHIEFIEDYRPDSTQPDDDHFKIHHVGEKTPKVVASGAVGIFSGIVSLSLVGPVAAAGVGVLAGVATYYGVNKLHKG